MGRDFKNIQEIRAFDFFLVDDSIIEATFMEQYLMVALSQVNNKYEINIVMVSVSKKFNSASSVPVSIRILLIS